ncbi:hypothetical protein [Streptomyces sp. NPDC002215]|uniref:hypothetical protein n=1 Tax=Streptomyces sp. NPDC002215 TaxID=3154412 RepID=UPI003322CC50
MFDHTLSTVTLTLASASGFALLLLPALYIALVMWPNRNNRTAARQPLILAALYLPSTIVFGLAHVYVLSGLFLFAAMCCVAVAAGVHYSTRTPQPGERPEPTTNAPSDPLTK